MYRIGLSSCFELNEVNFQNMQKAGLSAVEISKKPLWYESADYKAIIAMANRYDVQVWSLHLPFEPYIDTFDISSVQKDVREAALHKWTRIIKEAGDVGIDKFIVHTSGEPIADSERSERVECAMEFLDKLAEIAFAAGGKIAIEDLPRTNLGNTAEEMLTLLSANEKLRVCFDTNHLMADNNTNFLRKLGKKIITTHVSDYDFVDEKHWMPGEGKVDWKKLVAELKKTGYEGVWMYEVPFESLPTLIRPRDLTFEDFYQNAQKILK